MKLLHPWAMAVLTLVVLAAITGLVVAAGLGRPRGDTGTVSVAGCDFVAYAMHGDIYRCGGGFTADHQSFTIPYVTFTNSGRLAPGHRVPVRVTGPSATTAVAVTESRARLIVTLGGAVLLAVALIAAWRPWLKARRAR